MAASDTLRRPEVFMDTPAGTFEHGSSFDQGEVSGNLKLTQLEAHYSDMFSDVIEDGVITQGERAQLDRAAEAMGLDKARLDRLEQALQYVYESRNSQRIVDLSRAEEPSPVSLAPMGPSPDARVAILQKRVAMLEAKVLELQKELEDARSHVAVEVDLSGVAANPGEDAVALERRLAHDPRDASTLRALYRIFASEGDLDRRFCVAEVLHYLKEANDDERALYERYRSDLPIRPVRAVGTEPWRRFLFHPEEELLTGEVFSIIVGAVLLGRVAALKRDKLLPRLDPARKLDPAASTIQAVRCFSWAAATLGMSAPPLYADPDFDGLVEMVPGVPPSTRLGGRALSGRTSVELAFLAGRHIAWHREEHFIRLLVSNLGDLEDIFLAALVIGNPGIPLKEEMKRKVAPLAQAIEPLLQPESIDRLRSSFLRFVEEGGRTNIQRWAAAADKTASRAGLLLAGRLDAAASMLEAEGAHAKERIDDLLSFLVSERYSNLRQHLGISVGTARA